MLSPAPRILNVDDFDDGRLVKSEILRMAGFQVIEASTGKEALRQVANSKPDLVLLDVKLPDINGFEVCRRIKKLRGFAPMVLHISMAYNLVENQTEGLESGADAYLVGPVEPDLLIANVRALLRMQKAEQEVRDAGKEWQTTFDAISDGVALIGLDGTVIRHNRSFLDFIHGGFADESFVGSNISSALGAATLDQNSFPHVRAGKTKQKESVELNVDERWIRMIAEPIVAEDGTMQKLVITLRDFTARKSAEIERSHLLLREQRAKQKAEESERRFRTMAETMHQLVLTLDAEGHIEYCNRRWDQQTGVHANQMHTDTWTSLLFSEDQRTAEEAWQHSFATGETFEREVRLVGIDKEKRWYICRALPELDEWGRRLSWVLTFTDIHAAKIRTRDDLLLAKASEFLGKSFDYQEHLPKVLQLLLPEFADYAAIDLVSDNGKIVAVGSTQPPITGLPLAKVVSTGLAMIVEVAPGHQIAGPGIQTCVILPLQARGNVIGCLSIGYRQNRDREGDKLETLHHFANRLATMIDNAELYAHAQREIADRKRVERELRESEHKFRVITESMPQIVWIADSEGKLEYLNHQWYELTGHKLEADAVDPIEYLHEDDRDRVAKAWAGSVRTGEVFDFEFRLLRSIDHTYLWHLGRAVPLHDVSGHVQRWIGTITKIDDKRRAEEQSQFLAQASQALMNCLDVDSVISRVGQFIVPTYADWLSLDLVDDSGDSRRVLSLHHDPVKAELLKRVYEEFPSPKTSLYGYPRVLKTGRSQLISPLTPAILENVARTDEHRAILVASGMRSMMCVPLVTRNRVVGCLTASITEKRRLFDQRDLVLIEDLANRIATTLDNAQLLADTKREVLRRREAEATASEAIRDAETARLLAEELSRKVN